MERDASGAEIDVSVLIPVLNEEEHIGEAARSMLAQRFDGSVEFLYIDGRSEDSTRAILEELAAGDARVRVLDNPRRTTPHALNLGLAAARGEHVVRMDAHTYYPPHYIATGVARLRQGDVDWVCGPQVPLGSGRWSRRVALALGSWLGTAASMKWPIALPGVNGDGDGTPPPNPTTEYDLRPDSGVFGGVWRRSTLTAHDGWDEAWPVNQDSELLARFARAGRRTVLRADMGAEYVPRDGLQPLARQYWRYGQYRQKTFRRYPETLRPIHLLPPALIVALSATMLGGRGGRAARRAVAAYALMVAGASLSRSREIGWRDAASLPVVFSTMHFAWGLGYLYGCLRFGLPLAAIAEAPPRGLRPPAARRPATAGRLRVLHVTESFASGVFGVVDSISRRLAADGHEVTIAYGRRPETPENVRDLVDDAVDLVELPLRTRSPREQVQATVALRRLIALLQPDVIHLHSSFAGVLGLVACPPGTPIVYSPHAYSFLTATPGSLRNSAYRGVETLIANRVDVIGAVSEFEAGKARELMPSAQVVVIPNGIEELDDPPDPLPRGELAPTIVTVGRIGPQRNPNGTARIMEQVRDLAETIWIGAEPSPGAGTRALQAAGVRITGWLPRSRGWNLLREASALLHWSEWEGQSLAILEALAAGVPVVASDIPPNREVLGPDQVFASEDAAARTLRRLMSDDGLRAAFLANQDRRRRAFSAGRMTSEWLELYGRLAGDRVR